MKQKLMSKKYIVDLTEAEQETLHKIVKTGKQAAYKINHAHIFLKADINQVNGAYRNHLRSLLTMVSS